MSAGWSWAFDTPFDWFKQNASRLGGTNQNMVVSWPKVIKDKGGLREQFVHVIDIVPTLLEVTGIGAPEDVDGIKQKPIEGTSFAYTFDAKNAKAPSHHKTQYFEMMGQYALYHDGWIMSTKVNRAPWQAFEAANPDPLNNQVFQLYNLEESWNQANDIAAQHPDKVKEMRAHVPRGGQEVPGPAVECLGGRPGRAPSGRASSPAATSSSIRDPMTGVPQGDAPFLLNTSYTITADITVPEGGAEGMIVTSGGRFARLGLLPAGWQTGVLLEPARSRAHQVGRPASARARQAYHRVRLQV